MHYDVKLVLPKNPCLKLWNEDLTENRANFVLKAEFGVLWSNSHKDQVDQRAG